MLRLRDLIDDLNAGLYNPVGLNILWPRNVAFLYVCVRILFKCLMLSDRIVVIFSRAYCRHARHLPLPMSLIDVPWTMLFLAISSKLSTMSVPFCQKTFVLFELLNAFSSCLVKGFAFSVFCGTRIGFRTLPPIGLPCVSGFRGFQSAA